MKIDYSRDPLPEDGPLRTFLVGYWSSNVVSGNEESLGLVICDYKGRPEAKQIKVLFRCLLDDKSITATRKLGNWGSDSRGNEELAQARLQEIWDLCFGENGVLND